RPGDIPPRDEGGRAAPLLVRRAGWHLLPRFVARTFAKVLQLFDAQSAPASACAPASLYCISWTGRFAGQPVFPLHAIRRAKKRDHAGGWVPVNTRAITSQAAFSGRGRPVLWTLPGHVQRIPNAKLRFPRNGTDWNCKGAFKSFWRGVERDYKGRL